MTGFGLPASAAPYSGESDETDEPPLPLTVLIPCLGEREPTLYRLLDGLHPAHYQGELDVWLVVQEDAVADIAAARRAIAAAGSVARVVTTRSCTPKARAVNAATARVRTPLVAVFDADTRLSAAGLRTLATTLTGQGLDMVEAFDLCTGTDRRARAGNAQALAFHASMQWLSGRFGRRFMGSSVVVTRKDLFTRLGGYPEHGVEEGYRWSMNSADERVRHALVPVLVPGDVPGSVRLMLRQRTRWVTGQLAGSLECLFGGPGRDRRLAAVGFASLLAQGLWSACLFLSPVLPTALIPFALGAAVEIRRLRSAAKAGWPQTLGVRASPLLALVLEVGEGIMVWRGIARLVAGRAGHWDTARPGSSKGTPPTVREHG
ncbi:glycosyltransferase [Streptomyces griseoviridis]